jgi:hypothetical protein
MRRLVLCLMLGAMLVLGACGGPAAQQGLNDAGTAVADPAVGTAASDAAAEVGTAVAAPDTGTAMAEVGTAVAAPELGTAAAEVGTAVMSPDTGTVVAEATGALSAVADDITLQEGEQLILDATQSAGNIADYKWTVTQAPAGAETVIGQVINEGSSGNVTLDPTAYEKYFPVAGSYTIQLTVTDSSGQSSNDEFTIDVP